MATNKTENKSNRATTERQTKIQEFDEYGINKEKLARAYLYIINNREIFLFDTQDLLEFTDIEIAYKLQDLTQEEREQLQKDLRDIAEANQTSEILRTLNIDDYEQVAEDFFDYDEDN